ncbi:MAG TPA: carbohydrate ABC transporter permease [Clostridiaceae bacterium]|nr:carbohydrate ABC transporter permease [Clostridiaceae bacterium]
MYAKVKHFLAQSAIYFLVAVLTICCLLPFLMVVSGSLSTEEDIMNYGYTIFPKNPTLLSYRVLFQRPGMLISSYIITITVTVLGTIASLIINSMIAYAMTRKTLKYRKFISIYCLITILFSGGMVPWYIVCVNYLHLKDTLAALILPYLANGWYIFLLRNFFNAIPDEMKEAAKIDGAGEFRTFVQIIIPLAKPALATIGLFIALMYWNDWWLSLMLIDSDKLRPIQYLLRIIVSNITFLNSQMNVPELRNSKQLAPTEGVKMATCIITIGPIVLLYPFLQRFFIKGIMVGAVKG